MESQKGRLNNNATDYNTVRFYICYASGHYYWNDNDLAEVMRKMNNDTVRKVFDVC